MSEERRHIMDVFTEDDWNLVAVALLASKSKRSKQLASLVVAWRLEVARSRAGFLAAFRDLHKL